MQRRLTHGEVALLFKECERAADKADWKIGVSNGNFILQNDKCTSLMKEFEDVREVHCFFNGYLTSKAMLPAAQGKRLGFNKACSCGIGDDEQQQGMNSVMNIEDDDYGNETGE